MLNPAPFEILLGLCFLLCCCCTRSNEVHCSGSYKFRLVFLFLEDWCCCVMQIPLCPAWLCNLAAQIFLCLVPTGTWKAIICSCPQAPTSPTLPCLPWLTAFKKRVLYPSTGVGSICYQRGITPAAQQAPAKELALVLLHTPPICMQSHSPSPALVELARVEVWAQSHPGRWVWAAPRVCSRDGAFGKQEQGSHVGNVAQLSGMDSPFESPWVECALICVSLTLFAVIQCCD